MTQLGSMYPLPTVSAVAQAVSRAVGVSIPATLGGAASDLAADVRALFSANGGDFTGSMLDFTKTSRLFSDFEGTEAAAESTLALVLDDSQNGALGAELVTNGDFSDGLTGWTTGANLSVSVVGGAARITTTGAITAAAAFEQVISSTAGRWYRIEYTFSNATGTGGARQFTGQSNGALVGDGSAASVGTGSFISWVRAIDAQIQLNFWCDASNSVDLDNVSVKEVLGAHAYQSTSGYRPKSTTDAFGTRVAQPDGTDDFMNLPDGVLGDGTKHVHVFAAYSYNGVDSGHAARLLTGVGGAGVQLRHDGTPSFQDVVTTGSVTSATSAVYARALTDNETLIRAAVFDPVSTVYGRANGVEVLSATHGYGSLDDPGAGKIFGDTTNNSLAGTCHGIVILTGSRAMTAAEIAAVEAYLADLASDPLLTADPDTVLSRVFRPATDLNVTEVFASADWTDSSAGSSSITVNAGSNVTFNVVGADAAIADRTFRTRVGFRYTITSTSSVGVTVSADESTAGGTTYGTGASISFVATTSTVYVRASTTTNADTLTALAISESAATGTYYDLLDDTRLYKDFAGNLAQIGDTVALALPSRTEDVLGPELYDGATSADWNAQGTNTVEDDGDEVKITYVDNGNGANILLRDSDGLTADLTAGKLYQASVSARVNSGSVTLGITGATVNSSVSVSETAAAAKTLFWVSDGLDALSVTGMNSGEIAWVEITSVREVTGYPLIQTATGSRPALTASGLDFDGVDDYMEAVDPDADLAITGDVTVVSAVTATNTAAIKTVVASGDSTIATDTPYQASIDASELLSWEQADATNSETQTSANGPVAGTSTVVSWRRDGAVVSYGDAIQSVDSDTFTTVTSPTAGASPATNVGIHVDGSSEPFDGSIDELVIVDRALSTGLLIHLERAATEKTA